MCEGIRGNGLPCQRTSQLGSAYCKFHDPAQTSQQCKATRSIGVPCRGRIVPGTCYCRYHLKLIDEAPIEKLCEAFHELNENLENK